jgi:hypothetical protein
MEGRPERTQNSKKGINVRTTSAMLVLVSLTASMYYLVVGLTQSESMAVYSRANIPVWGIRAWAVLLGAGGVLLIFPSTFRLGHILDGDEFAIYDYQSRDREGLERWPPRVRVSTGSRVLVLGWLSRVRSRKY